MPRSRVVNTSSYRKSFTQEEACTETQFPSISSWEPARSSNTKHAWQQSHREEKLLSEQKKGRACGLRTQTHLHSYATSEQEERQRSHALPLGVTVIDVRHLLRTCGCSSTNISAIHPSHRQARMLIARFLSSVPAPLSPQAAPGRSIRDVEISDGLQGHDSMDSDMGKAIAEAERRWCPDRLQASTSLQPPQKPSRVVACKYKLK